MSIIETIFIGSGGKSPGVDMLNNSRKITRLISLEEGASIYDMQFDPKSNILLAGCRDGYLRRYWWDEENQELVLLGTYFHGSPVISVMQSANNIHSVGTDGKVMNWRDLEKVTSPVNPENQIVAFESLSNHQKYAGLTANGDIYIWDEKHNLVRSLSGPAPSGPYSLTTLFYWKGQQALVYPAEDGRLVQIDLRDCSVNPILAHKGGFVAVFGNGNMFFTAGMGDGKLKIWSNTESYRSLFCETGIINGSCFSESDDKIVLITKDGQILDCIAEEDDLCIVNRIAGDYRCVMRTGGEAIADLYDHVQKSKAQKLQMSAVKNIDNGYSINNLTLYSDLESMGYKKAVLALRVYEGQINNDLAAEFKARYELCGCLEMDQLDSSFLHRYLSIALDVGIFDLAQEILREYGARINSDIIDFVNSVISSETNYLAVDIVNWNIETFCQVWSLSAQQIHGVFVLEQGTCLPVPDSDGFIEQISGHLSFGLIWGKLLDHSGYNDLQLIRFAKIDAGSSNILLYPALVQKESSLSFVIIAEIDHSDDSDFITHNLEAAKHLESCKGKLSEFVSGRLLSDVQAAVMKTINERKAKSWQMASTY